MPLEQLILKRAERRLEPYRLQAEVVKKIRSEEYELYIPRIQEILSKATY